MRKGFISTAVVAFIIISVFIWRVRVTLSKNETYESQIEKATLVEVATVEVGDITQELSLVGDIEAQAQVFVFTKIPGKVEKLKVKVGSVVRKDDVLAVIEHKELLLGVKQAQAALKAAQAGLDQAKALSKIKIMSQVQQAQAGLSAAKAAFDQVKDISFTRTNTQIAQAEGGLEAIKASLKKIKEGARAEEKKQVESAVEQAKAALDSARSNYERMTKLFDNGAISEQTLEGIETQYTVAKAQYEAATQQLKLINEGAREEDIQTVEAQVKQAEAALQLAKTLADTKSWEKDIALAQAQVKQAEAGVEAAIALQEAKSWEAEITAAETAAEQASVALELAQQRLADATITAPISGVVSQRTVDEGGMASPQMPIFQIVDMDVVKATVSVIESDLYKVHMEDEALVSAEALSTPQKGIVTLISPTFDKQSRTATVEISIDNKDHKLKPGMFARAQLIYDKHTSTLLVPSEAVDEKNGQKMVYIVSSNIAKIVPVQLGFADEDKIEITSGQLNAGDKVIVSGHFGLKDGAKVQVNGLKIDD